MLRFLSLLFFGLMLFGSWGWQGRAVEVPLAIMALFLLGLVFLGKIWAKPLPRAFWGYGLVILLMAVSLLWSRDWEQGAWWLLLYTTGGVVWGLGYMNRQHIAAWLHSYIVVWGAGLALLWLVTEIVGENVFRFGSQSLVVWGSAFENHNHLGDVAALTALIGVWRVMQGKRWWWVLVGLSGALMVMSLSRSAILGLATGYMLQATSFKTKHQKRLTLVIISLLVVGFVGVSAGKGIGRSRDYWLQAVAGVVQHPLGVGMGNFGYVSRRAEFQPLNLDGFSYVVHNIGLEFVVGMGVLGILFIVWLIDVIRRMNWKGLSVYLGLWVALTVNFLFDSTYQIPAMVWLWFLLLAIVGGGEEEAIWQKRANLLAWGLMLLVLAVGVGFYLPVLVRAMLF
jgi:hypothetical protein